MSITAGNGLVGKVQPSATKTIPPTRNPAVARVVVALIPIIHIPTPPATIPPVTPIISSPLSIFNMISLSFKSLF